MADGSIRVKTGFDNSEAEKDAQYFINLTKKTADEVKRFSKDLGFGKMSKKEKEAIKANFSGISEEMKSVGEKLAKAVVNRDAIEKELVKVKTEVGKAAAMDFVMQNPGASYEQMKGAAESAINESDEVKDVAAEWEKANSVVDTYKSKMQSLEQTYNKITEETKKQITQERKRAGLLESIRGLGKKVSSSIAAGVGSLKVFALGLVGIKGLYNFVSQMSQRVLANNQQLAGQLEGMKNALASAFEPILERIISLAVKVFSYINAIVQALTGINLIAKANAKAIKGVGGAAKEAKAQLAGFDEMNVLSDNSSGGGGGGAESLLPEDIDTSAITAKLDELKEKVSEIWNSEPVQAYVNFVKTAANAIVETAEAAGKGFSDGFSTHWPNIKKNFSEGFGELTRVFTEFYNTVSQTIDKYLPDFKTSVGETFTTIGNVVGTVVETISTIWNELCKGLGEIWDEYGAPIIDKIGSIVLHLQEIFQAIWDDVIAPIVIPIFEKISQVWTEHIQPMLTELGKLGAAILNLALLVIDKLLEPVKKEMDEKIKPMIQDIMGKLGELWDFLGFEELFDDIKELVKWLREVVDAITMIISGDKQQGIDILKEKFKGVVEPIEKIKKKIDDVKTSFDNLKKNISEKMASIKQDIQNKFSEAVTNAKTKINGIKTTITGIKDNISTRMATVKTKLTEPFTAMKTAATNAWNSIKTTFSTVATFFQNTFSTAWGKVKSVFSTDGQIFSGIKDGIVSAFKNIVNGIIRGINSAIATPFNGINNALSAIRNITILGKQPFAGKIGYINVPQIPQLALGGVTAQPTFAQIGEAGREAVLPLTNQSVMDSLGESIAEHIAVFLGDVGGGNLTIPIYLDSKKIAEKTIQVQRKQGFATNGGSW